MVPYSELSPIEQAILNWRNDNPVITFLILLACAAIIAITYMVERKKNIEKQQREINRRRTQRRAWIKSNGGL